MYRSWEQNWTRKSHRNGRRVQRRVREIQSWKNDCSDARIVRGPILRRSRRVEGTNLPKPKLDLEATQKMQERLKQQIKAAGDWTRRPGVRRRGRRRRNAPRRGVSNHHRRLRRQKMRRRRRRAEKTTQCTRENNNVESVVESVEVFEDAERVKIQHQTETPSGTMMPTIIGDEEEEEEEERRKRRRNTTDTRDRYNDPKSSSSSRRNRHEGRR